MVSLLLLTKIKTHTQLKAVISRQNVKFANIIRVEEVLIIKGNQKVKSIIVTEVTVMSPFIMYSSQNPWNFLDMEVIMIKEDDKCLSPFQIKSIRVLIIDLK